MADDGFASGFDDAGADEEVLLAELGVAHAGGVALAVIGFGAEFVPDFGMSGRDRA